MIVEIAFFRMIRERIYHRRIAGRWREDYSSAIFAPEATENICKLPGQSPFQLIPEPVRNRPAPDRFDSFRELSALGEGTATKQERTDLSTGPPDAEVSSEVQSS